THENWLEQHRYLNMDDLREPQEGGAAPCRLTADPFSLAPCSLGQGRCAPAVETASRTPTRPRQGRVSWPDVRLAQDPYRQSRYSAPNPRLVKSDIVHSA